MPDYDEETVNRLNDMCRKIRRHVIEMTFEAGSGHPGGSLSSTEIMVSLFFHVMRHDPQNPKWDQRDRFILSKGHVAPVYYAALAESGYFPVEELRTLRKMGSRLQGHPAYGKLPGVEMSTGSLGQGMSVASGMALAARLDNLDYRVYCLCGDGEMQSGQNWEAGMLASHYEIDNLVVILDRNQLQSSGPTEETMSLEPLADKWRAFGWNVLEIDGHDVGQILNACEMTRSMKGPSMIIADTVKGKGVSFMENNCGFHGRCCTCDEREKALAELEVRK